MNEYEVEEAADRFRRHPVLSIATQFLLAYKNHINQISDGWPYWSSASQAARQLQDLIPHSYQAAASVSETDVRKAMIPIKSFCTKYLKRYPCCGLNWNAFAYVLPKNSALSVPRTANQRARQSQQGTLFPFDSLAARTTLVPAKPFTP